jgi:hypothetical protein
MIFLAQISMGEHRILPQPPEIDLAEVRWLLHHLKIMSEIREQLEQLAQKETYTNEDKNLYLGLCRSLLETCRAFVDGIPDYVDARERENMERVTRKMKRAIKRILAWSERQ